MVTRTPPQAVSRRASARGTTFVELLVTTVILAILATAVLPIAEAARRREQELQLRRALREIRLALDTYHRTCLVSGAQHSSGNPSGQGGNARPGQRLVTFTPEDDPDRTCYPKDLDVLVEGVETNIPDYELRFLRSIPKDPFNYDEEEHDGHGWEYRSTTDDPERNLSWDRRNVFDVRSGSEWQALDGSYYKDW